MKRSVVLTDRLGPDILSAFWTKGQVLHRERTHLKVPGFSIVLNVLFTKKGPFLACEKKEKFSFFNSSRRSSDLDVGILLLIKNEFPQYNIRITRGNGARYLGTSLIFTCSRCRLPRKNRKNSKCNTFKSIAPADHDSC